MKKKKVKTRTIKIKENVTKNFITKIIFECDFYFILFIFYFVGDSKKTRLYCMLDFLIPQSIQITGNYSITSSFLLLLKFELT